MKGSQGTFAGTTTLRRRETALVVGEGAGVRWVRCHEWSFSWFIGSVYPTNTQLYASEGFRNLFLWQQSDVSSLVGIVINIQIFFEHYTNNCRNKCTKFVIIRFIICWVYVADDSSSTSSIVAEVLYKGSVMCKKYSRTSQKCRHRMVAFGLWTGRYLS